MWPSAIDAWDAFQFPTLNDVLSPVRWGCLDESARFDVAGDGVFLGGHHQQNGTGPFFESRRTARRECDAKDAG